MVPSKKVIVIGAGFAGLSAAASLAQKGFRVQLLEKNDQPGGRARAFRRDGFLFDMGPSWYWMPDAIERFFNRFGQSVADHLELVRLDPSYQIIFGKGDYWRLPADYDALRALFEQAEPGSAARLDAFMKEARYKYEISMERFIYKPSLGIREFAGGQMLKALFRMDMFRSFSSHARKYFKDPRLLQLMEFPVLFLGAMPQQVPALYSMMNYADMRLGTWYPKGGMYRLVAAMTGLARQQGVEICLDTPVTRLETHNGKVRRVHTPEGILPADIVVAAADYHHAEQELLADPADRDHTAAYWDKRLMAPSCLLYYIGVNKHLDNLEHHNLFFEENFAEHARAIYKDTKWPQDPLFYVCCPSKTDASVAPPGMENLFILIPVAAGLQDTPQIRQHYFERTLRRLEAHCGTSFSENIIVSKSYAYHDFVNDYNAYKGNAYGLANTLMQTAFLKPAMRSRKVNNLFFAGQLTVPGPGVPPAVISGQIAADYIAKMYKN